MKIASYVGLITNSSTVIFSRLDMRRVNQVISLLISADLLEEESTVELLYSNITHDINDVYDDVLAFDLTTFRQLIERNGDVSSYRWLNTFDEYEADILSRYNYDYEYEIDKPAEILTPQIAEMYGKYGFPYYVLIRDKDGKILEQASELVSSQLTVQTEPG